MKAIVEEQREFFEKGILHMRPLTLQDVASKIGMHESTVSRVTSNKYLKLSDFIETMNFRQIMETAKVTAATLVYLASSPSRLKELKTAKAGTGIEVTWTPSPEAGVSADPLRGDPSAVLSVSSDPLPLREFLTIPAGNQVGRMPFSRFEGYGGAPARGRPNPDGAGSAPVENATNAQGSVGAGGDDGPLPRTEVAHSAIVQETRLDHPANGVFDVVVQSSGLEGFPESAGVLSGRPVYSVFLAVGAEREWTLQYCIPFGEEDNAEMDGGVVTLGSPQRVLAPYPRVTFRPPVTPRPTGYVMVHGYITEAGKFQDLRVLGAGDPVEQSGVLDVLERWEFRPAERGGSPVRVEVLLAIPAQ